MKFIESIRLEEGTIFHLDLHQRRADLTTLAHFGNKIRHNLSAALSGENLPAAGLYKIRITYDTKIHSIDVEPYVRREVCDIKLVDAPSLDYRYKYADRSALVALGVEVIIVQDGFVTDSSYANVCLYDGSRWLTPERPLLMGVARAVALKAGEIFPAQILASDVRAGKYQKLKLINCMSLFPEATDISLI